MDVVVVVVDVVVVVVCCFELVEGMVECWYDLEKGNWNFQHCSAL